MKNSNYLTKEEFNLFLKKINGLENGFYSNRPPIKEREFFVVDGGWLGLVKILIQDLIDLGWDKQICQVKEKFGGLRFHINKGNDKIFKRIHQAETDSYKICEICGENGKLRPGRWYRTLCDKHYENQKSKQNESI